MKMTLGATTAASSDTAGNIINWIGTIANTAVSAIMARGDLTEDQKTQQIQALTVQAQQAQNQQTQKTILIGAAILGAVVIGSRLIK
jgi:hypothetical protein